MPEYKDEHYIINAWSEGFTIKYIPNNKNESTFYNKKTIISIKLERQSTQLITYSCIIHYTGSDSYNNNNQFKISNFNPLAYEFILKYDHNARIDTLEFVIGFMLYMFLDTTYRNI